MKGPYVNIGHEGNTDYEFYYNSDTTNLVEVNRMNHSIVWGLGLTFTIYDLMMRFGYRGYHFPYANVYVESPPHKIFVAHTICQLHQMLQST